RAGDGWLAIAVASAAQWDALVGRVPDLAGVDRYDHDATDMALAAWAGER
ncbi:MAG: CoA transferase, partial [Actinobacteria bacterium]|nr:CoA transferase [Actinomycetota bacterium]NIS31296.1 CoA transferase [Actinomycetota bacterium]NIT95585.1 CoA transferase [Actinomycetota bacterium]NIU19278.1 CoA transferase [Actinomycetota bacterium]NIU66416.1 CoA transferase [Actinomycetota bacterium]